MKRENDMTLPELSQLLVSTLAGGVAHLGADSPISTDAGSDGFCLGGVDRALIEYGQDMASVAVNIAERAGDFDAGKRGMACFNASVQMTATALIARELRQGFALIAGAIVAANDPQYRDKQG